jgi:hypothetical protein
MVAMGAPARRGVELAHEWVSDPHLVAKPQGLQLAHEWVSDPHLVAKPQGLTSGDAVSDPVI